MDTLHKLDEDTARFLKRKQLANVEHQEVMQKRLQSAGAGHVPTSQIGVSLLLELAAQGSTMIRQ